MLLFIDSETKHLNTYHSFRSLLVGNRDCDSFPLRIQFCCYFGGGHPCVTPIQNIDIMCHRSWPESETITGTRVLPDSLPTCSTAATTSMPDTTFPNTTCFPSNQGVSAVQRKNCHQFFRVNVPLWVSEMCYLIKKAAILITWDPFVSFPAFAILKVPAPSPRKHRLESSTSHKNKHWSCTTSPVCFSVKFSSANWEP